MMHGGVECDEKISKTVSQMFQIHKLLLNFVLNKLTMKEHVCSTR